MRIDTVTGKHGDFGHFQRLTKPCCNLWREERQQYSEITPRSDQISKIVMPDSRRLPISPFRFINIVQNQGRLRYGRNKPVTLLLWVSLQSLQADMADNIGEVVGRVMIPPSKGESGGIDPRPKSFREILIGIRIGAVRPLQIANVLRG